MDKIKILAVDDEAYVLKIIKDLFHNHYLWTETSPLKASSLIKDQKFDIFIIDYQMKELTGIDLLKKIQADYKNHTYVSILCTASGTIYLFKEELKQGVFDYFAEKPFDIKSLKQIMDNAIITLGRIRSKAKQG